MTKIMITLTFVLLLSVLYTVEGQAGAAAAASAAAGAAGGGYTGGYPFGGYRPGYVYRPGYSTYLPNPSLTSSSVFAPVDSRKDAGVGILSNILNHAIVANLLNNGPPPPTYG